MQNQKFSSGTLRKVLLAISIAFCMLLVVAALQEGAKLSAIVFVLLAILLYTRLDVRLNKYSAFLGNPLKRRRIFFGLGLIGVWGFSLVDYSSRGYKVVAENSYGESSAFAEETSITPFEKVNNSDSVVSNIIPGITPVDVYGNFEQKGFAVNKQIGANDALFICTSEEDGIDYEVKTYSEEESMGVTAVRFTALRTDPQENSLSGLKPFFKYGCSIPYDGADPEKIATFIDKNWEKDKATTTISGVRFTIYCPTEFARIMEVEKAL